MIENHGKTRKCPETFPADTGSEINPLQIDRRSADQADAVRAEFDAAPGAQFLEHFQVVQHAGRSFARAGPQPPGLAMAFEHPPDLFAFEHGAPLEFKRVKHQAETLRVV